MSQVKTEPVRVTMLADREVADSIVRAPAGAIQFYSTADHKPAAFHFQCPCGCGAVGGVTVAGQHCWEWNGSKESPTVRPSVELFDERNHSHWHGYLTDGVWRSC